MPALAAVAARIEPPEPKRAGSKTLLLLFRTTLVLQEINLFMSYEILSIQSRGKCSSFSCKRKGARAVMIDSSTFHFPKNNGEGANIVRFILKANQTLRPLDLRVFDPYLQSPSPQPTPPGPHGRARELFLGCQQQALMSFAQVPHVQPPRVYCSSGRNIVVVAAGDVPLVAPALVVAVAATAAVAVAAVAAVAGAAVAAAVAAVAAAVADFALAAVAVVAGAAVAAFGAVGAVAAPPPPPPPLLLPPPPPPSSASSSSSSSCCCFGAPQQDINPKFLCQRLSCPVSAGSQAQCPPPHCPAPAL